MKFLARFEEIGLTLLLVSITVLAFIQVFTRYVFQLPLPWLEELGRYLMVWMVFLGAGLGIQRKTHIGVELIEWISPPHIGRKAKIIITGVIIVFSFVFLIVAKSFLQKQLMLGQVSPAGQYSMGWVFSAILVGGILLVIHGCHQLLLLITGKTPS